METDEGSRHVLPFQLQFDKPLASQVKMGEWNPEKDLLAMVTEDSKVGTSSLQLAEAVDNLSLQSCCLGTRRWYSFTLKMETVKKLEVPCSSCGVSQLGGGCPCE